MLSNQVISYEDKKNIQNSAFKEINDCCDKLSQIEEYFELINDKIPSASYANFRDALFHYQKICEAPDLLQINGNIFTLKEHLLRSIKDAMISLINSYVTWAEQFIKVHNPHPEIKAFIDIHFPEMKNIHKWSMNLFENVSKGISALESYSAEKINAECLHYCIDIVQQDSNYIQELRKHVHILKNHNHKIRSSSSILAKPYSNNEEFRSFQEDVRAFVKYIKTINIQYSIFFMN